jgi:hypothetical protein
MKSNLIKIVFVTLILFSLTLRATAPNTETLTIFYSKPVEPYKKLIYAIGMVETKCDTLAYNPIEQAVGYFQIRPIRVKDYNRRTGSHYKLKDMYNYQISEKIFLYYAEQIGPYDPGKIARNWNGSGVRTYYYWNRVKKYL